MSIKFSVGRGGVNRPEDVRIVQMLLNSWREQAGLAPLGVDSRSGPETAGAITAFQQKQNGFADGRVDPDGPTLLRLVRLHNAAVVARLTADLLGLLAGLDRQLLQVGRSLPPPVERQLRTLRGQVLKFGELGAGAAPAPAGSAADRAPSRPTVILVAGPAAIPLAVVALALFAMILVIVAAPVIVRAGSDILEGLKALMVAMGDAVRAVEQALEDLIKDNPRAGMKCSDALLEFRSATAELLNTLAGQSDPWPVKVPEVKQALGRWVKAVNELCQCLGIPPLLPPLFKI
jgi:hypothetical protein